MHIKERFIKCIKEKFTKESILIILLILIITFLYSYSKDYHFYLMIRIRETDYAVIESIDNTKNSITVNTKYLFGNISEEYTDDGLILEIPIKKIIAPKAEKIQKYKVTFYNNDKKKYTGYLIKINKNDVINNAFLIDEYQDTGRRYFYEVNGTFYALKVNGIFYSLSSNQSNILASLIRE